MSLGQVRRRIGRTPAPLLMTITSPNAKIARAALAGGHLITWRRMNWRPLKQWLCSGCHGKLRMSPIIEQALPFQAIAVNQGINIIIGYGPAIIRTTVRRYLTPTCTICIASLSLRHTHTHTPTCWRSVEHTLGRSKIKTPDLMAQLRS